jgi:hypothetical protein
VWWLFEPSLQSAPWSDFHLGLTYGYVAVPASLFPQEILRSLVLWINKVAVSENDSDVENIITTPGSPKYIALEQDAVRQRNIELNGTVDKRDDRVCWLEVRKIWN